MPAKVFVDTNVLVYIANRSSEFHQSVLKKFMEIAETHDLAISRQVIREYAVIMTRPGIVERPLTAQEVSEDIEKWKHIFEIVDETEDVTDRLVALIKQYDLKGKRIHDANIVATMLAYSITALFTINTEDFKKFDEIALL